MLKVADLAKIPLPLANLIHDRLLLGTVKERGDKDCSAISLASFEDAGLDI